MDSLKSKAWESRANTTSKSNKKKVDYVIEESTDLQKRTMKDIVGTIATKVSLTKLLMSASVAHLKLRKVDYFIIGISFHLSEIQYFDWLKHIHQFQMFL